MPMTWADVLPWALPLLLVCTALAAGALGAWWSASRPQPPWTAGRVAELLTVTVARLARQQLPPGAMPERYLQEVAMRQLQLARQCLLQVTELAADIELPDLELGL